MRSITTFDLQYAHRFYGFQGEAQYLHGHTGTLTIEVEDTVEEAHLQSSVFKLSKDLIDSIHEEGIVAYTS